MTMHSIRSFTSLLRPVYAASWNLVGVRLMPE